MYPPQSSLKPPILANYVKFADHFPIHPVENDIPQIYSKCSEIRSIRPLLVRITRNPRNPHQFHTSSQQQLSNCINPQITRN